MRRIAAPESLLVAAAFVLGAAGCANPINDQTFFRYTTDGNAAHTRGNLEGAAEMHRRALINARVGRLGPEKEAVALHNLGRVKRDQCKLDEADEALRAAYQLRDRNPATPPASLTGTIFELAQLSYERGRHADAAALMERGFPLLPPNIESMEPAAFAHILVEYAEALRKLNRAAEADAVDARVKKLVATYAVDLQRPPARPPFGHPACN